MAKRTSTEQKASEFVSKVKNLKLLFMMAEAKRCGIDPGIPLDDLLKAEKEAVSSQNNKKQAG